MILTALPNLALVNKKTAQNIGTSVSINYGNLASPANGLIVTATWSAGVFRGAGTFNDTGGNLYLDGELTGSATTGMAIGATAYPVVNPGTITLNGTASQLLSLCVSEWSGLGAVVYSVDPGVLVPFIDVGSQTNGGNSTTASVGPISNANFGNLLYIATAFIEASGLTITDGAGWTNICSLTNEALGSTNDTQYKIVPGGTSLTATWTFGSSSQAWLCGIQPFLSAPMPPPMVLPQAPNRASTY